MEYERHPDGSITEIPPAVLDCGHRFEPGATLVRYWPKPAGGPRARCYRCASCGQVTYAG